MTNYIVYGGNESTASTALGVGSSWSLSVPSGLNLNIKSGESGIHPKLYFKYIKTKLSKTDLAKLKPRIQKLKALAEDALAIGQRAVYENLLKQLAITIREQEAVVVGYDTWVDRKLIEDFKDKVRDKVVELCTLEEFPRVLPAPIRRKLQTAKDKGVFDEFYVLHTNLSGEKLKTQRKKIIEKDPILFGAFSYDNSRLFYIADWIDEYCDLTLRTFTEIVHQKVHPDWRPAKMTEPTEAEMKAILDEVMARHKRLEDAQRRNFRGLAAQEEVSHIKVTKKWYQFWK